MAALQEPMLERFHLELLEHVKAHFPSATRERSDEALLEHIREALDRAARHGLSTEKDLYRFVNVSMVLGPRFDEEESTAWAREYLSDSFVTDPGQRLQRLCGELLRRMKAES